MKFRVLAVVLVGLFSGLAIRADLPTFTDFRHNSIIQDSKTKISYYVESDRCHVVAISPDGIILWCTEIIPAKWEGKMFITRISFMTKGGLPSDEEEIDVREWRGGQGGGWIDKKTGVYTEVGMFL